MLVYAQNYIIILIIVGMDLLDPILIIKFVVKTLLNLYGDNVFGVWI